MKTGDLCQQNVVASDLRNRDGSMQRERRRVVRERR